MFYSQFILAKKGPLGTIWIAAHLERKLRKNQVADTDIGVSVDSILFPDVPIALRLSSHLLLGVVRIYSKKVNYLFDDCSEALLKVKQAFRSTAVDLPPEQSKAPYHSITLPETFDLDDFELPDNEIFQGNDHHVSSREQITLQDTMEGVSFSTSQFGPDERFGDGDASQIGLDLDEDLFMEKGEPAGVSGNPDNSVYRDPKASVKQATPFRGDEQNEGVSDLASASPIHYFSIQAPSTPGLMEEPNFSAHEALISDDHMDDDHNLPEMASKEASGTASGQVHNLAFDSNGDCCPLGDQENTKERSKGAAYSPEAVEPTTSANAQPLKSNEHNETMIGVDCLENELCESTFQKETSIAGDMPSKGYSDNQNEVAVNEVEKPQADNGISTEVNYNTPQKELDIAGVIQSKGYSVHQSEVPVNVVEKPLADNGGVSSELNGDYSCGGFEKSDLNGTFVPGPDHVSGDKMSLVGQEDLTTRETEGIMEVVGSDFQNEGQDGEKPGTLESNGDGKSLDMSISGLRACNSRTPSNFDGVENVGADASSLPPEDDGLCSLGISGKEIVTNVSGISVDFQDQMSLDITCLGGSKSGKPLETTSAEDQSGKESNFQGSDFSAPEKLLSMPNVPATLVGWTPDKEILAEGVGGSGEKFISGKKRSYTESTLTIQSLNSESSGAAQSKQSVEYIPEDDDLLSSILGGKRSTGFKLKPTPDTTQLPTKRQRVSVRSSTQKRKVLVDDSMVLHGDTIREQLTNTGDIRRVRKKAPCTRLEVWVLQKQFLEDEVFSEPVFTGMSADLRSLCSEAFDLSGIKIVHTDGRKNVIESLTPSTAGGKGRQQLGDTPCMQESTFVVDGSILQKELETFDNEIAKQMSQNNGSGKKLETENRDEIIQSGGDEDHSVVPRIEPSVFATPPEVDLANCTNADLPYINNTSDRVISVDTDANQLLDQRCNMGPTGENVPMGEDVSGSGREAQEVVYASEKLDSEEKSDGTFLQERINQEAIDGSEKCNLDEKVDSTCLSERMEGVDTAGADLNDTLPLCDVVTDSMSLGVRSSPTLDHVMEECDRSEPRFDSAGETVASDTRHDDGCATFNNHLMENVKLDASNSFEADLSSHDIQLNERENLECWEADPKSNVDSTAVLADYLDPTEHQGNWRDAIEHDTDFLNADDDEVDEDYESDMPNSEEKRILDNSGWSTRTRAVANYLQVLFEKETYHAEKVIPLESLLAGKSRKEASRMFFETLVLKTKDYIDTEQVSSFSDIKIKPAGKLLKSDFVSHT